MAEPIYPIPGPWRGELAIVACPLGGDWLGSDVNRWKQANLDTIVSFLEDPEKRELALEREAEYLREQGLQIIQFPIPDLGVPSSTEEALKLVRELDQLLSAGHRVGVHCRQGIGRSGLIAASLLVAGGLAIEFAVNVVSNARHVAVPETSEQREWLEDFSRILAADLIRQ